MVEAPQSCVTTWLVIKMLETCTIRPLSERDLPIVLSWRNHPDIRRHMFSQHEIKSQEHQDWFARVSVDATRCVLMVEDASMPLGYVQFNNVAIEGVADWGFYVKPNATPGSGQKLGVTALNYGFEVLRLHKICGQVIASNHASIRFHERLGFKKEGELRDQQRIEGQYHNLIYFGLLSCEWG